MERPIALTVFYFVCMALFGTTANVLVIRVYGKRRHKTNTEVLIIFRAAIDMMTPVLAMLITASIITSSAEASTTTAGRCYTFWTVPPSLFLCSYFLQVFIAVNRFLEVKYPERQMLTPRRTVLVSTGMVILPGIFSLIVIVVGLYRLPPSQTLPIISTQHIPAACLDVMATINKSPFKIYAVIAYSTVSGGFVVIVGFYMAVYAAIKRDCRIQPQPCQNRRPNEVTFSDAIFTISRSRLEPSQANTASSTPGRRGRDNAPEAGRYARRHSGPSAIQNQEGATGPTGSESVINDGIGRLDVQFGNVSGQDQGSTPGSTPGGMPRPATSSCERAHCSQGFNYRVTTNLPQNRGLGFKAQRRGLQKRATHMMLASAFPFFVYWVASVYILVRIQPVEEVPVGSTIGVDIVQKIVIASSSLSPLIYLLVNKHFRQECVKVIRHIC